MQLTLIRHATLLLEMAGRRILVDPMLDPAGAQPPLPDTADPRPNPLVELPLPPEEIVRTIDATVVTHLHPDHFDASAMRLLPRDRPLFCQGHEAEPLGGLGFSVAPLTESRELGEIRITPAPGRHGHGPMADAMGPVTGVVLQAPDEPVVYVVGDSVWCDQVAAACDAHRPGVIVVNAGEPRFTQGGPLTMDAGDVVATAEAAPEATVVAVHMEAYNHCGLTREALGDACAEAGCADRVVIPRDGDTLDPAPAP